MAELPAFPLTMEAAMTAASRKLHAEAADAVRAAYAAAGRDLPPLSKLPKQIVATAAAYNVPIEEALRWIRFSHEGKQWTLSEFSAWCEKYAATARQLRRLQALESGYNTDLRLCPQCLAHPAQRLNGVLICRPPPSKSRSQAKSPASPYTESRM